MAIPDNSSIQDSDICRPSMWGICYGEGKSHKFYCRFCALTIKVNFPRWSRCLNKVYEAEDIVDLHWVCPSCCKGKPDLMYIGK